MAERVLQAVESAEYAANQVSADSGLLAVLDLMREALTLTSEEGRIVHANAAALELFGYSHADIAGQPVTLLNSYPPDENARIVAAVLRQLEAHGVWEGEWVNRRKDGSSFIGSARISGVIWRSRRHWLCAHTPVVTNTYPSENDRLALAAEAAELGIWEWDIPSNTFIYSPRARAICGLPADGDVTYQDVVRLTHPEDFPYTSAQASRALDPGIRDKRPFEYRIVRPDGALRWVRAHGYAVFADVEGSPRALRYIGTLEDITDRTSARRADQETARQVRLALEAARMAVWSLDLRNWTLTPSPEFNQLFGLPRDATPSLEDVEARYAPGVRQMLSERWHAALSTRSSRFEADYSILRAGAEAWIHVRCEISYTADGQPDRAVGIVTDITEQRAARAALRESDARFREAADSAPAPVWMTNRGGEVEFANQAMVDFAGTSRQEIMGDSWLALIHSEDLPKVLEARAAAWANNHAPYTVEARFRRSDSQWRWLEINARARRAEGGEFNGYVGLAVDRTEAREALTALAESEERFRLLADSAPVMIWMSDASGKCLYLNAALRRFWHVDDDHVALFDWRTMMHPDDEPNITAAVVRANIDMQAFEVQGRYLDAAGKWRILRTQGVPRHSTDGKFLGMIGVNVDLTELMESQERLGLLLEELNHRVKNTLAVVQGLAKQTFRADVDVAAARSTFDSRLSALAGAHTILTRSNWEDARLAEVAQKAVQICGESTSRVRLSGPDIVLTPKQALTIALALHELSTNAVKHGSLSQLDCGYVDLTWRLNDTTDLVIDWREVSGPLVVPPAARGFGSTLLERILPRDVNGVGRITFDREGLRYELRLPQDKNQ